MLSPVPPRWEAGLGSAWLAGGLVDGGIRGGGGGGKGRWKRRGEGEDGESECDSTALRGEAEAGGAGFILKLYITGRKVCEG